MTNNNDCKNRGVSCKGIKGLLRFLEKNYEKEGLSEYLKRLELPYAYLNDSGNWISWDCYLKMLDEFVEYTGTPASLYKAGECSLGPEIWENVWYLVITNLLKTRTIYKNGVIQNPKFNHAADWEVLELTNNRLKLKIKWKAGIRTNANSCLHRQGMIVRIPTLSGMPPAQSRELQCQKDGHDCCIEEYIWQNKPLRLYSLVMPAVLTPLYLIAGHLAVVKAGVLDTSLSVLISFFLGYIIDDRRILKAVTRINCGQNEQLEKSFAKLEDKYDELKITEENLKKSESLLNETQRLTKVGGWEFDVRKGTMYWTDEVYNIYEVPFDYDPNDVHHDMNFYSPESVPILKAAFERAVSTGVPYDLELQFITAKGRHLWVRTIGRTIQEDGETVKVFGNLMAITDRKLTEERVLTSLKEKEVLLKEIHHRVKNNMQVISSLLNLQARQISDKQHIELFNESRNRISSMALVHEKLYNSKDLANVDFKDYIHSLANNLFSFYGIGANKVLLKISIEDISLSIDSAIPCGLIINELVSNALKYAFPQNNKGELNIILNKAPAGNNGSDYNLIISDNGIGIAEDINIRKTGSLGLQLVTNLVEHQLQGSLQLDRSGGTLFNIHFSELKYKNRI